jgi:hypothetical protein
MPEGDSPDKRPMWAVFSDEPPLAPRALAYDDGGFRCVCPGGDGGFRCVCPGGDNGFNDCEHRNRVEGSVGFVPAMFVAAAASLAVKLLCGLPLPRPLVDPEAVKPRRPTRLAPIPPS